MAASVARLSGDEAKSLVCAYGLTTPYEIVKARLLEKFHHQNRLDHGQINEIFTATHRADETYEIFAIRLQVLSERWGAGSEETRKEVT